MANNTEQIRFLWDLAEEASDRRDALTEATDLRQDRIDWDRSARPRLEQVLGKGDLSVGFNNPDKAGSLGEYPDPNAALDAATELYDADINYLQEIRKSLAKPR
jgi:hypothetical protein